MNAFSVTLITRTYGERSRYLIRAAESIFSQKVGSIQWIVVQDGYGTSADTIGSITAPSHITVSHVTLPKTGRSAAANAGLDRALGDLIGFLDDDDELFCDHCLILSRLLDNYPFASGAYAGSIRSKKGASLEKNIGDDMIFMRPTLDSTAFLYTNPLPIQSVLFRKSILESNRFDESLDALEDWLFWAQLFFGRKLIWTPSITSRFYIQGDPELEALRVEPHRAAMPYLREQLNNLEDRYFSELKVDVNIEKLKLRSAIRSAIFDGFVI